MDAGGRHLRSRKLPLRPASALFFATRNDYQYNGVCSILKVHTNACQCRHLLVLQSPVIGATMEQPCGTTNECKTKSMCMCDLGIQSMGVLNSGVLFW